MTLSQVLQKRMEEFEKEFGSAVKEYDLEFGPWDGTSLGDDLKSFSLATSLALAESFEEMMEVMRKRTEIILQKDELNGCISALEVPIGNKDYNQALDDLRKLLSEEKKKLISLMK